MGSVPQQVSTSVSPTPSEPASPKTSETIVSSPSIILSSTSTTTPGTPLAYITTTEPDGDMQGRVVDMMKWPVILKPKLNETCFDQQSQNYTVPIMLVNVTALYEILTGKGSPLDEYFTTTYLTSLDSYYKLYDFDIESYEYKNTFLHDALTYLLNFRRKLDTDNNVRRILERISFSNNVPLCPEVICNKLIFDELPKPKKGMDSHSEIFFRYNTLIPCHQNGFISYNIGTSLMNDLPSYVRDTLSDFFSYSNKKKIFEGVKWEDMASQKDVVDVIVKTLENQNTINENQRQAIDYLYQHLKCDVLKLVPPTIFKECLMPDIYPDYFMKFTSDDICQAEKPFSPTNITYYLDIFTLLKTLTNVESKWVETLVSTLTNPKVVQKINLPSPFVKATKGELFREILKQLATARVESIPISTIQEMSKSIDMFGYGATPVEATNDCPNNTTRHETPKLVSKANFAPCNISELPVAKMSQFINIQSLLDTFKPNTSRKLLGALRNILQQPNVYTILPKVDDVHLTKPQFLKQVLNSLKTSSPTMTQFADVLASQVNSDNVEELKVEKACQTPINTNGGFLVYPTAETCSHKNYDLDVSKLLQSFHPNISQSQITALGTYMLSKNKDFYNILLKQNIDEIKTFGELLQRLASQSPAGSSLQSFFSTLPKYQKNANAPTLSFLTDCSPERIDLATLIDEQKMQEILRHPDEEELSFRSIDDSEESLSDAELKEIENSVVGQTKLKEYLYLLLGGQNYTKQLEILQRADLFTEDMYRGFDVIEFLPHNMAAEILLKRYLNTKNGTEDEDTIGAVKDVLAALAEAPKRRKRQVDWGGLTVDLLEMISNSDQMPDELDSKINNLIVNLQKATVDPMFEDVLPYVRKLETKFQLPIGLRMLYKTVGPSTDASTLRELHNFFAPPSAAIPDTKNHYQKTIHLLNAFTKSDPKVKHAKMLLRQSLRQEVYDDRVIPKMEALNHFPKKFLIASLKRFRMIVNKRLDRQATEVWLATEEILKSLRAPDFGPLAYEDCDIVDLFRAVIGSESILKAKEIVLRHVIANREQLKEVFDGLDDLENFSDEEKVLIIVNRLLKQPDTLEDIVEESLNNLSEFLHSQGYDVEETFMEHSDVKLLIGDVLDATPFNGSDVVYAFLTKAMDERPEVFEDVLRSLVFTNHETPQQQLSEILRRMHRVHGPRLGQDLVWAINSAFKAMNTNLRDSSEDKFAGDFVPNLSDLIEDSLPEEIDEELQMALNVTLDLVENRKFDLPTIMKGIRLFMHPNDLRSRVLLFYLRYLGDLTAQESKAIELIWNYLDVTEEEVLDELVNEYRSASHVLNLLLRKASVEIVKEKEVILNHLKTRKNRKNAYRGVRNSMLDVDVMVKILENISKKLKRFDHDIAAASNSLLKHLEIPLRVSIPNGSNRLLKIVGDLETTFENSQDEMREALDHLVRYIKTYPSVFSKILLTIPGAETGEYTILEVLKAIQNYEKPISSKTRSSAAILKEFLLNDDDLMAKKIRRKARDFAKPNLNAAEINKFEAVKEASVRFLSASNNTA